MSALQNGFQLAKSVKSKLPLLNKLRSEIFGTVYNPYNARTGSKYLKHGLKGPKLRDYYGSRTLFSTQDVADQYNKQLDGTGFRVVDGERTERLARAEHYRRVGKAAPPKKTEKVVSNKKKRK
ncbi:hypothetical protein QEN19_002567 [Hanseniaspora menglaensis]